jgi:hypothetical protein
MTVKEKEHAPVKSSEMEVDSPIPSVTDTDALFLSGKFLKSKLNRFWALHCLTHQSNFFSIELSPTFPLRYQT